MRIVQRLPKLEEFGPDSAGILRYIPSKDSLHFVTKDTLIRISLHHVTVELLRRLVEYCPNLEHAQLSMGNTGDPLKQN